jgi:hypothetical protein
MIADVVNFAIAGIGFCHAAGRLIFYKGITASMKTVMTENWTGRRNEDRGRNISASTEDF